MSFIEATTILIVLFSNTVLFGLFICKFVKLRFVKQQNTWDYLLQYLTAKTHLNTIFTGYFVRTGYVILNTKYHIHSIFTDHFIRTLFPSFSKRLWNVPMQPVRDPNNCITIAWSWVNGACLGSRGGWKREVNVATGFCHHLWLHISGTNTTRKIKTSFYA